MIALLSALCLALQSEEAAPPLPFDEVVELELVADDPVLIDGWGPTVVAEYQVDFEGRLHIWATSEADLYLQVDDASEARPLASDDSSGGGTTPYVRLNVREGDRLAALVAASPGASGSLTVYFATAPETEHTLAAAAKGRAKLEELERLLTDGKRSEANELIVRSLEELAATPGGRNSDGVVSVVFDIGLFAHTQLANYRDSGTAWSIARVHRERTLPESHSLLLAARANLAGSMHAMGDLAEARALREAVLAAYERALPEDHPETLRARANLAVSMHTMGDLAEARELREAVLAVYERTLPEDHPELLGARANLALSIETMGDLAGARALLESVLAACEQTLPGDHPELLLARTNLAVSREAIGDLAGARTLRESVLATYERTLPDDHPQLLLARANLASSMDAMGDLAGARALDEAVLAARVRTLPEDHPDLLMSRGNLAVSMEAMGDLAGARALGEAVLAAYERTLPNDHPHVLAARQNLAVWMRQMGDLAEARALEEEVLAAYERTLPADHPRVQMARSNLAASMRALGDQAGGRALEEAVVSVYERTLPENHPELLRARSNLAVSMTTTGALGEARTLGEAVVAARARTRPEDHPELLIARANLAVSMYAMGDRAEARALVPVLAHGMTSRVLGSLALAPRQALGAVASESYRLSVVLFLTQSAESRRSSQVMAFALTETLRLVAGEAARSLSRFEQDSELQPILAEAAAVRRELNDLMAGAGNEDDVTNGLSTELTRLSLERDRLEREASRRLAERGLTVRPIDVDALTDALGDDDVAVGYRRTLQIQEDEATSLLVDGAEEILAHVLRPDGTLVRIRLGPASELEELVRKWRDAVGAPLVARSTQRGERGVATEDDERGDELGTGRLLRARLLDPILEVAPEARRLFVCGDDLTFLVPLDALPADADKGRVGDRFDLVNEVSFARLLSPTVATKAKPGLLSVGGVDYSAAGSAPTTLAAASPPIEIGEAQRKRSGTSASFHSLPASGFEAKAIAALFEEAFGSEANLLTGDDATKSSLFEEASKQRYVHLATHGWFAPETIRSTADANAGDSIRMGIQERITGLAPMTLCGLALAGANRGRDSLGRVAGILTAEELSSLDLAECELAVLSACETNVGIRRAGQGIQSLQAALYAAGARTSITSLWKVDDAATRRLFELFYTNLWIEEMPKAEALWAAKKALRDEGHPPADWAGWVLTGDPK